jgi:hypothetical protein
MPTLPEMMLNCSDNPWDSDHDPSNLLHMGAIEIRRLQQQNSAKASIIHMLHESNVHLHEALEKTAADCEAAWVLATVLAIGLCAAGVCMVAS